MNSNKLYNLSSLNLISNGDESFVKKMLMLFLEIAPTTLAEMEKAFLDEDYINLGKIAHRFKPTIETLNIEPIIGPIKEIELKAVDYGDSNKLRILLDMVITETNRVISQIKQDVIIL
ncbi:hypothetical protein [Lacihabitans soyangensis]|uniref:Hpt domain-containing protein n=1 Tax=Lacihabitans soyangensis TaxID=869394 RepID=A0AAE3H1C0_9BACT|nr:hypothetical protein [Lacihabitans soyangensis]MCP9762963.1 Hpt domain-containing protein [Lacihabitans soyangensis]